MHSRLSLTGQNGFPGIDHLHWGNSPSAEVSANEKVESGLVECLHGDHTDSSVVSQQVEQCEQHKQRPYQSERGRGWEVITLGKADSLCLASYCGSEDQVHQQCHQIHYCLLH